MAIAKPGPLVGALTRCTMRYKSYFHCTIFGLLFIVAMQLLYLSSEGAAPSEKSHIFDARSVVGGVALKIGVESIADSFADSSSVISIAPPTSPPPAEVQIEELDPEDIILLEATSTRKPTVPKSVLGDPVLLTAGISAVTSDVLGNLGPPTVVIQEKMDDWLKDRWQAAVDMTGRPIPGPHWLGFRLDNPRVIFRVVIDFETAHATDYVIYGSESPNSVYSRADTSWFVLGRGKHARVVETRKQHVVHEIVMNDLMRQKKVRQIRLVINKPATQWGASIWRFQLWGF